ncbi:MAG: PorV/PorQ family protein [Chitinophagales bacterium]|nr:PorV/PorQ family protein [Chitinophagales bacterium]MDW8393894.1 PorV/PorQ family protein [Chitinophagales bacterium]
MRLLAVFFCLCPFAVEGQLLPSFGNSRTATAGFQFLHIGPDAWSTGMARSHLAFVNDASAVYWNPAGMAGIDSASLNLNVSQALYFADLSLSAAAVAYPVSKETFVGASFLLLATGNMPVTTEFMPFGTGQYFRANHWAAGLSLARILTDNFRFGVSLKYVGESYADVRLGTVVTDFGFQYDVGKANTRFAVGMSNFGFSTEPRGAIERLTLNGMDTVSDFDRVVVPAVFRIGVAWDPVRSALHRLTLCAQLNHPTDNNETYGLGAEYRFRRLVAVRSGYLFGLDEPASPTFGFGLRWAQRPADLQLDYGFEHRKTLGSLHRISLTLSL